MTDRLKYLQQIRDLREKERDDLYSLLLKLSRSCDAPIMHEVMNYGAACREAAKANDRIMVHLKLEI